VLLTLVSIYPHSRLGKIKQIYDMEKKLHQQKFDTVICTKTNNQRKLGKKSGANGQKTDTNILPIINHS